MRGRCALGTSIPQRTDPQEGPGARRNPARDVNLPRKKCKEHVYLTHEQVSDLALAAGERATLVLMLAYTGRRWGEAVGLWVKDVNFARRRLNVTVNAVEIANVTGSGTPPRASQSAPARTSRLRSGCSATLPQR